MKMKIRKKIYIILILLILPSVFAVKDLFSLQAKVELNGALVDDGNLTVLIYETATGGTPIYNSSTDYNNSIQDGFFDVMIGFTSTELDLIANGIYYMDLEINGNDLDWGSNERRMFQSPVGNITNLTNVLFVDGANKRIGIGTNSPSDLLNVRNDADGEQVLISLTNAINGGTNDIATLQLNLGDGTGRGGLKIKAGKEADFSTGANRDAFASFEILENDAWSEKMRIASSGNVGIGTTAPSYTLDLGGGTTVSQRLQLQRGSDDTNQHLRLGWDRIESVRSNVALASAQTTLSFNQVGSDGTRTNMFIDTSGNVGINTTAPGEKLHVVGNIASVAGAVYVTNGGSAVGSSMFSPAANELAFSSAGAERVRIDSSGKVGIGTTAPAGKLTIVSTSGHIQLNDSDEVGSIRLETDGGGFNIDNVTSNTNFFRIDSSGKVGIGETSPARGLDVKTSAEGDVLRLNDGTESCDLDPDSASVTETCSSDARLKENIRDAAPVLDYIRRLPIRDFTIKASGEERTGVVAQEIMENYPELVIMGDDGYYKVQGIHSWKLIKAIQELKSENDELRKRIEALESKQN